MNLPDNEVNPETDTNNSEPQTNTVNLSFKITEWGNFDHTIEGATVTIGDITGVTGSAGGCTLRNVPIGEATVIITADGYKTVEETWEVTANDEGSVAEYSLIKQN